MAALAQLIRRTRDGLQAIVELAIARFHQRLMQIAFGKIARGIVDG